MRNIVYDGMHVNAVDWAIELTQCYMSTTAFCDAHPSSLTIENVTFVNFDGVTDKVREPNVATVVCSSPNVCGAITVKNFTVVSPEGTNNAVCTNVDRATLGLNCTSG